MTTDTARSNAREKQSQREEHEKLIQKWKELLLTEKATEEDYLAIGGTKPDLQWFFYTHC